MSIQRGDNGSGEFSSLVRLHEVGMACIHDGNLTTLLDHALDTIMSVAGADFGSAELIVPDSRRFASRASGGLSHVREAFLRAESDRLRSEARVHDQRTIIDDARSSTRLTDETRRALLAAGALALQSTPLRARSGESLGVISIYFERPGRPTSRQTELVDLIARHTADFIECCRERLAMQALCADEQQARARSDANDRSKDEFLAILAHELRQPLAALFPALEVQKRSLSAERRQRAGEVIAHQIGHIARLVEDLADASRVSRGKIDLARERLDLREVVDQAIEMARPMLERRRHATSVTLGTEPTWIMGDATRMKQVFSNLLQNSASYTPPGGHVTVSIGQQDGQVYFRVRDDGVGIPPEALGRIFQIFERGAGPTDAPSVGIGLAVVRRLVELHGGTVSATSDGTGQGSEFVVTLPAAPPA
jgi:signal transduction histidine kinase